MVELESVMFQQKIIIQASPHPLALADFLSNDKVARLRFVCMGIDWIVGGCHALFVGVSHNKNTVQG